MTGLAESTSMRIDQMRKCSLHRGLFLGSRNDLCDPVTPTAHACMQVRCIVRPRQNPADFLRDWGATTVQADLQDPTSLPAALVGIHTVIDCSTARPEESTQKIDWEGKVALMQCAQVTQHSLLCATMFQFVWS